MAKRDIKLKTAGNDRSVVSYQTEAGATAIKAGEPVKLKAAGSPYVIPLATAEPVIGTTSAVIGIANSDSSHTASADGIVDVFIPQPSHVFRCKATTAGNVAATLVGDNVTLTLGSGVYSVNEDEGNAVDHGLQIVGVNTDTDEIYFTFRPGALEGAIA